MQSLSKNRGFTLIELMVVIAIIGILASIAIPQFNEYRKRSFNSAALSDLRNIMTAEEAYYVDQQAYVNLTAIAGYQATLTSLTGARLGLNVCARVASASAIDYTVQTEHKNGDIFYTGSQSGNVIESGKTIGVYTLGC